MPHVMAERIQELNKQYQVYYVERMSFGGQHYAYDDMHDPGIPIILWKEELVKLKTLTSKHKHWHNWKVILARVEKVPAQFLGQNYNNFMY